MLVTPRTCEGLLAIKTNFYFLPSTSSGPANDRPCYLNRSPTEDIRVKPALASCCKLTSGLMCMHMKRGGWDSNSLIYLEDQSVYNGPMMQVHEQILFLDSIAMEVSSTSPPTAMALRRTPRRRS
ncbi:hypothetical protein VNO77_15110 [Canavalia gladiata]|uniref:Uncharacterized protein n=1 Tax=Canavalia gladiata TaxID=3824 RepID=A0AAN9LZ94_CANGL